MAPRGIFIHSLDPIFLCLNTLNPEYLQHNQQ
jgi:hypothetical protein